MIISTSDVALLLPNLINNQSDFTDNTSPTKSNVEKYIEMSKNIVFARLRSAGYTLPLIFDYDNKYQEEFLKYIIILGVAKWISKNTFYPLNVKKTSEESTNIFETEFNKELKHIYDIDKNISTIRLDTPYLDNTAAHKSRMTTIDGIGLNLYDNSDYNFDKEYFVNKMKELEYNG